MNGREERRLAAAAVGALLVCLSLPIYNPDLFWHLSAARRMAESGAVPRADWLSSTMRGAPWADFEWGSQVLFGLAFKAGGFAGLWLLKVLLLGAAAGVFWRLLGLSGAGLAYRSAALALWSAASFTRSDIRPELISTLGFALAFLGLESRRQGTAAEARPIQTFLFFAAWANFHAGFAYGLVLITLYAGAETLAEMVLLRLRGESGRPGALVDAAPGAPQGAMLLWVHLAAAAAGSLIQPSGPGAYGVLWRHWRELGSLTRYITEWGPIRLDNPWHWPAWVVLFASFGAALAAVRAGGGVAAAPLGALLYFGSSAFQHARLAAYFCVLAPPLGLGWLEGARLLPSPPSRAARAACWTLTALCLVYLLAWGRRFDVFRAVFQDRFIPVGAADFLEREEAILAGRTLYNPWGWGGYLGWRLYPKYPVFQDGRYIFHPLLEEAAKAIESPTAWQGFLDRRGTDTVLLENLRMPMSTTRVYPDGSTRGFERPYYVSYMPRERWALVFWDDKSLLFVRRAAVPEDWLTAREYRYARPFDDEALADALRRGEVPEPLLRTELERHASDLR